MFKPLFLVTISFLLISLETIGQNPYRFSGNDSLNGFDEKAILETSSYQSISKEEMNNFLNFNQRYFINQKYNLLQIPSPQTDYSAEAKTAVAYCVNEDFEEASLTYPVPSTVAITATNAINGWVANSGSLSSVFPQTANCLLQYCCTAAPNHIRLISAPGAGYIDPLIGTTYPLYSIFGSSLNVNATSLYGYNSYGDWFIKLNDQNATTTPVNRISKSIIVSSVNSIFDFAYLSVVHLGHCCCDAEGASVIFKDSTGTPLLTYSVSGGLAGSACFFPNLSSCSIGNTDTIINETSNDTSIVSYDTLYPTTLAGVYYTKWIKRSVDLSPWIGSLIKIEMSAFDCVYNGHFGYCYFDSQCRSAITTETSSLNDKSKLKIYPNPNSGNFNIDIGKEIYNGEIELRNILGQTVHKQSVKQGNNSIKTENLAKGIYNYSVLQNKEIVSVGKLVIE